MAENAPPATEALQVPEDSRLLAGRRYGRGPRHLLAFHGFAESSDLFHILSRDWLERYTIHAFDLPFHGRSPFPWGEKLREAAVCEEFEAYLRLHAIERFSLIGYSLGGRLALLLAQTWPERIEELFLVASDGIRISPWYYLATAPLLNRLIFKPLVFHPQYFLWGFRLAKALGLADRSVIKFAQTQLMQEGVAEKIYGSWMAMRPLRLDAEEMAQSFNRHSLKIHIFAAYYDRVVPPKHQQAWAEKLRNARYYCWKTGHNNIIHRVANFQPWEHHVS